jgi:hypothetical protein
MQRPDPLVLNTYAMYSLAKSKRIAIKLANELSVLPAVRGYAWCCFYNRVLHLWYMFNPVIPPT